MANNLKKYRGECKEVYGNLEVQVEKLLHKNVNPQIIIMDPETHKKLIDYFDFTFVTSPMPVGKHNFRDYSFRTVSYMGITLRMIVRVEEEYKYKGILVLGN